MRVLLVNDDGYGSPGLLAMENALLLNGAYEVWVVAPDGERSGMSHSITLKNPIRSRRHADRHYDISGSPADCVLTAFLGIMDKRPDVVISGINMGPNFGTDITYSGTAAGARQAALMGVCGIAVSLDSMAAPWNFEPLAHFVVRMLPQLHQMWDGHHFLNINGPNDNIAEPPVCITHPCLRMYNDRMLHFSAPRGDDYWFLNGSPIENSQEEGTDWNAVSRGFISMSPIHLHPQNNLVDEKYRALAICRGDDRGGAH